MFCIGVQIPLFKGKDLSNLITDNYRGITLLSTFNKLFEILIWNRLKGWWVDEKVVSDLQDRVRLATPASTQPLSYRKL